MSAVHEWTGPMGHKFRDIQEPSGTYYRDKTPRAVIDGLERALATGARVRFWYGDTKTGRDWMEEFGTVGTVGRSTGRISIPLLISNARSHGGPAILCDCIVRLVVNGCELYRHPKYNQPPLKVAQIKPRDKVGNVNLRSAGYTHTVEPVGANFKSEAQAQRWVAFMRGERGCK